MKSLPFSAFVALSHVEYDTFVVLVSSQPNLSDVVFAMVMALFCFLLENSSNILIAVFARFPSFIPKFPIEGID